MMGENAKTWYVVQFAFNMDNHIYLTLFKMAEERHVEEGIGEEAGAEKVKPKSIKKPTGWNSFYHSVAVSMNY